MGSLPPRPRIPAPASLRSCARLRRAVKQADWLEGVRAEGPNCMATAIQVFRCSGVQAFGPTRTGCPSQPPFLNTRTPEHLNGGETMGERLTTINAVIIGAGRRGRAHGRA